MPHPGSELDEGRFSRHFFAISACCHIFHVMNSRIEVQDSVKMDTIGPIGTGATYFGTLVRSRVGVCAIDSSC